MHGQVNGTNYYPPSVSSPTLSIRTLSSSTLSSSTLSSPDNELYVENEANSPAYTEPSEQALLSTMPFTLLGLSSHQLPFKSTPQAKYTLSLPPTLPLPVVSLLHNLAEPSLLYRSLDDYVQSDDSTTSGLVGQSLRSAIGTELRGYVELVGALESQIRRAIASAERGDSFSNSGVTLKRCMIWTREATMGLRLMSQIVEKCTGQKGGQLISTIHAFASDHGDPFVRCFAERVLTVVTRPFYDMLRHWIYEGELMDPFVEFFVTEEAPGDEGTASGVSMKPGATSVWQDKYHFHSLQVPTIISEGFAKKVFLIGKSLNFIRHSCGENDWVDSYSKSTSKELRYGDTAKLEMNIDEAYKTTMKRLIELMGNKFKLFEHLMALKKFLLLGQGDFIALLMESLADNLDRPANTLYRHNLTAQLEHAIRGSNAQFENPDMLARLDARMLELSHGEVGWDVFTLEYKVEAPVDVVVTQYGSKQYLKVFNFLWRIKRVEYALSTCWRKSMTGARGVLRQVDDHVGEDWKRARCVVAEMVHFVNQLQYYILFEVCFPGFYFLFPVSLFFLFPALPWLLYPALKIHFVPCFPALLWDCRTVDPWIRASSGYIATIIPPTLISNHAPSLASVDHC